MQTFSIYSLNEVYVSSLTESKEDKKRPGVLKTVEGVFAEVNEKNRNGRRYSRKLWDNVLKGDYVKEMLNNRTLFGEAEHPSDRSEISLPNVSHVITDLKLTPEGKVMGKADILDTPAGKILNTLIEYGANIGISSRGMGTINESPDGEMWVDENNYMFVTFDFVPMPSVKIARPPVREGVEVTSMPDLKECLTSQIKSASSAEIPIIEKVLCQISQEPIFETLHHILEERKGLTEDPTLLTEITHLRNREKDLLSTVERLSEDLKKAEMSSAYIHDEFSKIKSRLLSEHESIKKENDVLKESLLRSKTSFIHVQAENEQLQAVRKDFESIQEQLKEVLKSVDGSDLKVLGETIFTYSSTIEKQKNLLQEMNTRYSELGEKTQKYVSRNEQLVGYVVELASRLTGASKKEISDKLKPMFTLDDIVPAESKWQKPVVEVKSPQSKVKPPQKLEEALFLDNILNSADKKQPPSKFDSRLVNLITSIRK